MLILTGGKQIYRALLMTRNIFDRGILSGILSRAGKVTSAGIVTGVDICIVFRKSKATEFLY